MKNKIKAPFISLAVTFLLACALSSTQAQTTAPQTQTQQTAATQTPQARNLPEELNFTPEQTQKWRDLNRELKDQQVAGNLKLQEARRALAAAMESPTPNEEVIKQRAKELADARSAMIQLQALRQARVLQMLSPEQRVKLGEILQRNQELKHQQQGPAGLGQRQQQLKRGANPPAMTPAQRKALRQQQKQKP